MEKSYRNRLAQEKSPYLLQHAGNPVEWYPWGEEAFDRAKKENRPVFLSIGYSTCHWCHVMAHESFEDPEVAKLLNETFISVKVDREERPDIDKVYMTVCQMMTGSGGWPLTVIMTPEKEPFFTATYIPRETRSGRIGLLDLVPRIRQVWLQRRDTAIGSAKQIAETLRNSVFGEVGQSLAEPLLHEAYEYLEKNFDAKNSGFGGAPKFPTPHNLFFLLRYWKRTGNEKALSMVEETIRAMRQGGIYDHVGSGFHRYSIDAKWLVPHFEKMLYDQALLAIAYTEAYQATGSAEYVRTAREIFTYVLRDMVSTEGGFYSAEDADSEGEEGKFYLWEKSEIGEALTESEAELAAEVFNIDENGNFTNEATGCRSGRNILYLGKTAEELASELSMSEDDLRDDIGRIKQKLFAYREKRVHPHKDDKILVDWNGLMIAALARGAQILDEPDYAAAAGRAVDFILDSLRTPEGRLLHRYRDGEAAIPAYIDDYTFFIYGLLELYEATFEVKYLEIALELNEDLIWHFWDADSGGFYFSADDAEGLLVRQKDIYDGAVPSGNSVAMLNLLRLGRITANTDYEDKADKIGRAFSGDVARLPSAYTQLMVAVDFAVGPSCEAVIAGNPQAEETKEMVAAVRGIFVPNKVVIFRPADEESPGIDEISSFTGQYSTIDGKATAYVCRNYNCQLPTNDVNTLVQLLETGSTSV